MPAVSEKQKKFMQAVAHSPKFAKKVGVSQSVGREFSKSGGGEMKNTSRMNRLEELGRVNAEKASTAKGKKNLAAEKKRVIGELKGGMTKKYAAGGMGKMTKAEMPSKMGKVATAKPKMGSASKRADGVAAKGKTKGKAVKMAYGGKAC